MSSDSRIQQNDTSPTEFPLVSQHTGDESSVAAEYTPGSDENVVIASQGEQEDESNREEVLLNQNRMVCRICRCDDEGGINIIYFPCKCHKNLVGGIHSSCLLEWVDSRTSRYVENPKKCEICKSEFCIEEPKMQYKRESTAQGIVYLCLKILNIFINSIPWLLYKIRFDFVALFWSVVVLRLMLSIISNDLRFVLYSDYGSRIHSFVVLLLSLSSISFSFKFVHKFKSWVYKQIHTSNPPLHMDPINLSNAAVRFVNYSSLFEHMVLSTPNTILAMLFPFGLFMMASEHNADASLLKKLSDTIVDCNQSSISRLLWAYLVIIYDKIFFIISNIGTFPPTTIATSSAMLSGYNDFVIELCTTVANSFIFISTTLSHGYTTFSRVNDYLNNEVNPYLISILPHQFARLLRPIDAVETFFLKVLMMPLRLDDFAQACFILLALLFIVCIFSPLHRSIFRNWIGEYCLAYLRFVLGVLIVTSVVMIFSVNIVAMPSSNNFAIQQDDIPTHGTLYSSLDSNSAITNSSGHTNHYNASSKNARFTLVISNMDVKSIQLASAKDADVVDVLRVSLTSAVLSFGTGIKRLYSSIYPEHAANNVDTMKCILPALLSSYPTQNFSHCLSMQYFEKYSSSGNQPWRRTQSFILEGTFTLSFERPFEYWLSFAILCLSRLTYNYICICILYVIAMIAIGKFTSTAMSFIPRSFAARQLYPAMSRYSRGVYTSVNSIITTTTVVLLVHTFYFTLIHYILPFIFYYTGLLIVHIIYTFLGTPTSSSHPYDYIAEIDVASFLIMTFIIIYKLSSIIEITTMIQIVANSGIREFRRLQTTPSMMITIIAIPIQLLVHVLTSASPVLTIILSSAQSGISIISCRYYGVILLTLYETAYRCKMHLDIDDMVDDEHSPPRALLFNHYHGEVLMHQFLPTPRTKLSIIGYCVSRHILLPLLHTMIFYVPIAHALGTLEMSLKFVESFSICFTIVSMIIEGVIGVSCNLKWMDDWFRGIFNLVSVVTLNSDDNAVENSRVASVTFFTMDIFLISIPILLMSPFGFIGLLLWERYPLDVSISKFAIFVLMDILIIGSVMSFPFIYKFIQTLIHDSFHSVVGVTERSVSNHQSNDEEQAIMVAVM